MSASEKLKDRLFGESQYEALDVDERAAVVAVVEAAEKEPHERDCAIWNHPWLGRNLHGAPCTCQRAPALAALDEALS